MDGITIEQIMMSDQGVAGLLEGIQESLRTKTYRPQAVQRVYIPRLEPEVDPLFHPDSYGYRPGKSALDAVGQARQRCWRSDWIIDLDIKGFFDNIDQNLLMRAVKKHAKEKWIVLYIERWLQAPIQEEDGRLIQRERGSARWSGQPPVSQSVLALCL